MNRPRHKLLANATFTSNQHGRVCRSDPSDQLFQRVHGRTGSNQLAFDSQLIPQPLSFVLRSRQTVFQLLAMLDVFQSQRKLVGHSKRVLKVLDAQDAIALRRVKMQQTVNGIRRPDGSTDHTAGLQLFQAAGIAQSSVVFNVACEDGFLIREHDAG